MTDEIKDILFHDRDIEGPHFGKTCNETLKDMVSELQDMFELIDYMRVVEDCSLIDLLIALEANMEAYYG